MDPRSFAIYPCAKRGFRIFRLRENKTGERPKISLTELANFQWRNLRPLVECESSRSTLTARFAIRPLNSAVVNTVRFSELLTSMSIFTKLHAPKVKNRCKLVRVNLVHLWERVWFEFSNDKHFIRRTCDRGRVDVVLLTMLSDNSDNEKQWRQMLHLDLWLRRCINRKRRMATFVLNRLPPFDTF